MKICCCIYIKVISWYLSLGTALAIMKIIKSSCCHLNTAILPAVLIKTEASQSLPRPQHQALCSVGTLRPQQ